MKLGIISDIHANKPALDAVLNELEKCNVDGVICLGDIIGVLGSPNSVVETVKNDCLYTIYGNHDARVFDDVSFLPNRDVEVVEYEHAIDTLTDENRAWLQSLSSMDTVEENVVIAHAYPESGKSTGNDAGNAGVFPRDFINVASEHVDDEILLLGHTHVQHAVNLSKFQGQNGLMLNPGSVGYPYDHESGDESIGKASFAIIDTETEEYSLRSVEYDSSSVVEYLSEHNLP